MVHAVPNRCGLLGGVSVVLLLAGAWGRGAEAADPGRDRKSVMEIRLEGTKNGQGFPVLKIHLTRGGEGAGFLLVRFPEGIDTWAAGGKHTKFYQDVRSPVWPAKLAAEPVRLPAEWLGDADDTGYVMPFDNGMRLRAQARVIGARVVLSYELEGDPGTVAVQSRIWSCVQLAQSTPLADLLMERTGVPVGGKLQLFRDLVPVFEPYPRKRAVSQRFTAYASGRVPGLPNPQVKPHPGFADDRDQDIYFWHAPKPLDVSAIATLSRDGAWSVVTVGRGAPSVWTNPGISCQHADPDGGGWEPGGTLKITNAIHIVEGGTSGLTAFLRSLAAALRE